MADQPGSPVLLHAREMRKAPTDAERTLWKELRGGRFAGAKFRRQQPIGPFIVDFCCFSRKLIVEVDGGSHGVDEVSAYDAWRSEYLASTDFRVVRFWNSEVLGNIDGVLKRIEEVLCAPASRPSRVR